MTAQRTRPTRPAAGGGASAGGRSGGRPSARTATVTRPGVPPARRGVDTLDTIRRAASDAARKFPVEGATALAPDLTDLDYGWVDVPPDLGPTRARTAAEREAADERAARRAEKRKAGRSTAESRRRLRVAPPLPVTVARAPFVAMLLSVVVVGVIGILVLTTMINANQFTLNDLQNRQAGLNQQEQQLQQNLAQQESPGSLVAAAHRLGLVPAGTLAYITMPNGTIAGVPQPAAKAPSVTAQTPSAPARAAATTGTTPASTTSSGSPAGGG
jgi:type II secretory pathway pseudopilin PulG